MADTTKKLAELERENDLALVEYWAAVELVDECECAVENTREFLALRVAKQDYKDAQNKMSSARLAFMRAKVAQ